MLRASAAAIALVTSATLAGCAFIEGGDGRDGNLVRLVELSMDPEGFEGEVNDATDVFAAIADTRFEYTHEGDAVDAADVTVAYVDESGRERDVPLTTFTDAGTIGRGDRVTITGALLTSPVRIESGGDLLAARGGSSKDWLEVGGYPLPLAMRGGLAVWDVDGDLGLDAGFDLIELVHEGVDEEYSCVPDGDDEYGCTPQVDEVPYRDTLRLTGAAADGDADLDGRLRIDSVGSALRPAFELGLEGNWVMAALFNVHVLEDRTGAYPEHMDADVGFELDLNAVGDGALRFTFDDEDQLEAVGGEGDLDLTGDIVYWDEDHPRAERYSPGDVDELDVHTPYDEQPVHAGANPSDFVVRALADLWRMDLVPGDEFSLDTAGRFGGDLPSATVLIRVVGEESKRVPAGTFDALRVTTSSVLNVPVDGGATETFELPALTTWIDEDSGIPVAIEQTLSYDYGKEDFAPLFDAAMAFGEDMTLTRPQEMHVAIEGRTVAELVEHRDGFSMAPMASMLLPFATVASPFASFMFAPFGYPFLGPMGMHDDEYGYAPDVAFSLDETQDRLTVVHVESGLASWEFELSTSPAAAFTHNGAEPLMPTGDGYGPISPDPSAPMAAGDFLDFCGPEGELGTPLTLRIRHVTSNTLVYESTLETLAAC